MSNELLENRRFCVLVVDSHVGNRRELSAKLNAAGIALSIKEANSVADAIESAVSGEIELCFVGKGLSTETQERLLTTLNEQSTQNACALIAVARKSDHESVFSYIRSGAHGVLLTPIEVEALKAVVETALMRLGESIGEKRPPQAQITSLPWVLESVAGRLNDIASRIRKERGEKFSPTDSSKLIKEALLSAFAPNGKDAEAIADSLLEMLPQSGKQESEERK